VSVKDNLKDAHNECTGNNITAEYGARCSEVGSIYRGMLKKVAADEGQTDDEFVRQLFAQMYNPDEDTITISGAYATDSDYGMTESALLTGIVYDCLMTALDVPERVLDHLGTTKVLDGQQEDSWNDYNARWTYHPDSGVSLTIWTES
jgi:hypothetical protein